MEKIQYREATFDVVRLLSCERTRVRDAANNYLHTHWDFTVEVNWHPSLVSYKQGGAVGAAPIEDAGQLPGETDIALLNRLLQPRGLLKVTAGSSIILESPSIGGAGRLPCDVKGGPSCEMIGVPVMIGIKHWFVTLHFIADVRDQAAASQANHSDAVISNLWVSSEDIDFQRRSVRHTAGRAILRADVMRQNNVNANSFRDLYVDQCPNHYQRTNVSVSLSEDGTVLDYSYEDVMQGYDRGPKSPILSIECFRTGYLTCGSPGKIASDVARSAAVRLAASGLGIAGEIAQLASGAGAGMLMQATIDNIPKAYMQVRCDLIGDRNADLGRLTSIALGICVTQLNLTGIDAVTVGTTEMIFRQDIADQVYTSVEVTIRWTEDAVQSGRVLRRLGLLRQLSPADQAALAQRQSTEALVRVFKSDSRTLTIPAGFDDAAQPRVLDPDGDQIVVTRDQARYGIDFAINPPMTNGAYGVNINSPPANGVPNGVPGAGAIPVGIEKMIVQALLGIGVAPPPQPRNLVNQS